MHISRVHLQSFRRFTDLTIDLGDAKPQLVMLCGPNGSGKSSLFDALRSVVTQVHGGFSAEVDYYQKAGVPSPFGAGWNPQQSVVTFHEIPTAGQVPANAVYVRTAYRNDPEFAISQLQRATSPLEGPQVNRMIDNDARVSDNYQRLVGQTIASLYDGHDDDKTGQEIRDRLIGQLRGVVRLVFARLGAARPRRSIGRRHVSLSEGREHRLCVQEPVRW